MNQNPLRPRPRQQTFEFMKLDVWRHLPTARRQDCHQQLIRLLQQVLHQERQDHDERKD